MSLTKRALTAYRERWQAVADFEIMERRDASMTQRWQKLNSLVHMAKALDILPTVDDDRIARERWDALRKRYLMESQKQ